MRRMGPQGRERQCLYRFALDARRVGNGLSGMLVPRGRVRVVVRTANLPNSAIVPARIKIPSIRELPGARGKRLRSATRLITARLSPGL